MCKEGYGPCCQEGTQGVQGMQGAQGIPGSVGPMGPQGVAGPQGVQGLQGVPGKDCDGPGHHDCCGVYCNVFSVLQQVLVGYNSGVDYVKYEGANAVSADFDLSMAGVTGVIKFLKHGIYNIAWLSQARTTPPVPSPVPSWSFGLWLSGILVPGSISSAYTQAPGDDDAHTTGEVIIEVKAGDTLVLRNASVTPITMDPLVTGAVFPITTSSINISLLKAMP